MIEFQYTRTRILSLVFQGASVIDILNVIATSALAIAAIVIAWKANDLAGRSVRVEVDKHVFEWGQRCLSCLSQASSLRLMSDTEIDTAEFKKRRREIRAEVFSLKEEGALFFIKNGQTAHSDPALDALHNVTFCMDGRKFLPPEKGDYDKIREPQNMELRKQSRRLIAAVQRRVGDEWAEE